MLNGRPPPPQERAMYPRSPAAAAAAAAAAASALLAFIAAPLRAQTIEPAPAPPPASAPSFECKDVNDAECTERRRRAQDQVRERVGRGSELNTPTVVGDAPLPPQGEPPPPPIVTRGPLHVRRFDLSAGVDHALSDRWVLGGIVGYSRGKLERSQSTVVPNAAPNSLPELSDTTIRTHSSTLTATLTWFPQPDVFIDGSLAYQRTSFDVERLVNSLALFSGSNDGRSWGLSLSAGTALRGEVTVVPQVGLDYVDSRIDALNTGLIFIETGERADELGLHISERRSKTWSGVFGLQVQKPLGASFGTVTPYARVLLRQRLSQSGTPAVATAVGATPVTTDLESQGSKRSATLAVGLLTQTPGGVSVFGDVGVTRGSGDVREQRVSIGIKFEI
jgi:outer membrane autotransporter protein